MRKKLQHIFNPLHIYCRILDHGVTKKTATKLVQIYEKYIYIIMLKKILYGNFLRKE